MHRRFGWKFWAFISGGAALSAETEEFFKRVGYAVVQGYGLTETASLISLNHPFRATEGSIGKVLPGREFSWLRTERFLCEAKTWPAATGKVEGFDRALRDKENWLRTGDIGEVDTEGNLRFKGRKKNVIVTAAGLNIYPEDIEAALRNQTAVRDCVVIPVERGGNAEPCAVLLMDNSSESKEAPALAAIEKGNASLAEYQRVHHWLVWPDPDFPRTPTGKPRISLIAARAAELLSGFSPHKSASGHPRRFAREVRKIERLVGESGEPAESYFSRSRGTDECARRALPGRTKRNIFCRGENRCGCAASSATTCGPSHGIRLPAMDAARGRARWLRLAVYYAFGLAGHADSRHPKIVGRGISSRRSRAGAHCFESHHPPRRYWLNSRLASAAFSPRLAIAMGGESLQRMRQPPRDWYFRETLGVSTGLWPGHRAVQRVSRCRSTPAFAKAFRFAGESADRGYSILVFPEGEVNNSDRRPHGAFPKWHWLAGGKSPPSHHSDASRRRLANEARTPAPGPTSAKSRSTLAHRLYFLTDTPPEEIARRLESIVLSL